MVVAMVEKMDARWVGPIGLAAAAGALLAVAAPPPPTLLIRVRSVVVVAAVDADAVVTVAAAAGALPCLGIAVLCGAGVGGLLVEGGEEESFERIVGTYGVSPLSWL